MTEAELFYVRVGRRRTIHRGVTVDGVDHVATERCNVDDAKNPAYRVQDPAQGGRVCRWCFPGGST